LKQRHKNRKYRNFYVTGTDTGVGKTEISLAIIRALQERDLKTNAMKPVAAGCIPSEDRLLNDDATRLQLQSSSEYDYSLLNPYAFEPPIAPHIAAAEQGVDIDLGVIETAFKEIKSFSDAVIVEGIGGWCVPVNRYQTTIDMVRLLSIPVIMVVGLRLGCLNHALLTWQSIKASHIKCVAWVANTLDPEQTRLQANYRALTELLPVPCMGIVPHYSVPRTEEIYRLLNIDYLLKS